MVKKVTITSGGAESMYSQIRSVLCETIAEYLRTRADEVSSVLILDSKEVTITILPDETTSEMVKARLGCNLTNQLLTFYLYLVDLDGDLEETINAAIDLLSV